MLWELGIYIRKQYNHTPALQPGSPQWVCPPEIPGKRAVRSLPVGTECWRKTASCDFSSVSFSVSGEVTTPAPDPF